MRLGIIATHAHPLPSPGHTGDSQLLLDLCWALNELGHQVMLFAPTGTVAPAGVSVATCDLDPSGPDWERAVQAGFKGVLNAQDIVHDWSVGKTIARDRQAEGKPFLATMLGGTGYKTALANTVANSRSMADRLLRGATDYEGSPTPDLGGPPSEPFKAVMVAHCGIDTQAYHPAKEHEDWFLWLSRWHPVRGYKQAIQWAKLTGLPLKMVGEDPRFDHPYQAGCAREAMALAEGMPNVTFEFLPPGPDHHEVKRGILRRAKALINPYRFCEPFGLSQIEAMASGVPCLSSALGSGPEIISDGVTGFVASTVEEFAIAARRVNQIDRRTCRAEAVERFDRMVMARNYVRLYERVLGGNGWGA